MNLFDKLEGLRAQVLRCLIEGEIIQSAAHKQSWTKFHLHMLSEFLERRKYMIRRSWCHVWKVQWTWDQKTYNCRHTSFYITLDNLMSLSLIFVIYKTVVPLPPKLDSLWYTASQIFDILLYVKMIQEGIMKTLKIVLIEIHHFNLIKK